MYGVVVNGSRNNTLKTFPEAYRYVKAMLEGEAAVPYQWDGSPFSTWKGKTVEITPRGVYSMSIPPDPVISGSLYGWDPIQGRGVIGITRIRHWYFRLKRKIWALEITETEDDWYESKFLFRSRGESEKEHGFSTHEEVAPLLYQALRDYLRSST